MYVKLIGLSVMLMIGLVRSLFAQHHVESRLLGKRVDGLPESNATFNFLIVGDWGRNGQGDEQAVADWMGVVANQVNAKFVISTGDNFYCCGVASRADYQWIASYEEVFRSHSLQIPWYVTLGNHDYQGNVQAQIDYTQKSRRWNMPDRYYTKAIHDIRFLFTDTSPFISKYYDRPDLYNGIQQQDTTRQLAWVDSVLLHSTEKWKIVIGHHPVYSVGDHGSEPDMKRLLGKRMEQHGADIYVAGHDHSLQSLQPRGDKMVYLISGGGSECTAVKNEPPFTRYAKSTTGFMLAAVGEKSLTVYFIDSNGQVIYKEALTK